MAEGSTVTRNITLIAALVLALGIILGGYLLGDGLRRARMADRAVTVRGLAERNVTADLATWTINLSAQGNSLGGGAGGGRPRHPHRRQLPSRSGLSGERGDRRRRRGQPIL